MSWVRGRHFMLIRAADLSSSLTPGLVVNAWHFSRARISSGRSLSEAEQGRTPGWLIHCSIFHLGGSNQVRAELGL